MSVTLLRRLRTIVLVAILAVAGVVWFQARYGDPPPKYAAHFDDAAELVRGNDVRINDVKVGRVTNVDLDGLRAKVTFTLREDITLGSETTAEIRQASLLGDRFVDIHPAGSGALRPGDVIAIDRTRRARDTEALIGEGARFTGALAADDVNTLLYAFEEAYGDDPQRLGRLIDASADSVATFNDAADDLTATIDAVDQMAGALAPRTEELAATITQFADGLQALGAASDDLRAFTVALDDFSGSLGNLLTANRERLRTFGVKVSTVLDEVVDTLPEIERGLAALYDFNASWACIGDAHYIQQTFLILPEAATIDYGPGHCDPENGGNRNRDRTSQIVVEGLDATTAEEYEAAQRGGAPR